MTDENLFAVDKDELDEWSEPTDDELTDMGSDDMLTFRDDPYGDDPFYEGDEDDYDYFYDDPDDDDYYDS